MLKSSSTALQQAYDSLLPGSALLWLRLGSADGSLICDREVQLSLQGSWKSSLNSIAGRTYLSGALKVKGGTVKIGDVTFR